MASKEEILIEVKANLAGFKKSMEDIKKVATSAVKDIEKSMTIDLTNAGIKAGSTFVNGFKRQIDNISDSITSALNGNNGNVEIKLEADTSAIENSLNGLSASIDLNTGSIASSGTDLLGASASLSAAKSMKDVANSISTIDTSNNSLMTYAKYVGYAKDALELMNEQLDSFKNKNEGNRKVTESEMNSIRKTYEIVKNELSNIERTMPDFKIRNIDTSSLDYFKKEAKKTFTEFEKMFNSLSITPNAPNIKTDKIKESSDVIKELYDKINRLTQIQNDIPFNLGGTDEIKTELDDIHNKIVETIANTKNNKIDINDESIKNAVKELDDLQRKIRETINMENPPKWGSDILKEIIATEDYLSKNVDGVADIYRRAEDAANEYIRTNDKIPPSMQRIIDESNLLKGLSTFGNSEEDGIAFLRVLQDIDTKYQGTYSSIKASNLGQILKDQFNIDIDPSIFDGLGNNLTKALKAIEEDTVSFNGDIDDIAETCELNADKIRRSFEQIRLATGNSGSFMTTALSGSNKPLDNLRNKINNVANVASVVGTRITNAFSPVRDKLTVVSNTISNKLSPSLNKFFNESKRVWTQFNSSLGKVKTNIQEFGNKLKSIVSHIPGLKRIKKEVKEIGDKAGESSGKVSKLGGTLGGLVKQLAGLFGLYKLGSIFMEGTKEAIKYEASIMQLQRTIGGASKTLIDFADNNAISFGISKKQVAEYGNIFSILVSNFESDATKIADTTQGLLESAGIISGALGYDVGSVLENLRSGVLGSSEAVDQLGLNLKVAALEASDSFAQIANGASSWNDLSVAQQQAIITQEILNQTTAKYGGIVTNTASMQNVFSAQLANTRLALGNVGKAIWTAVLPALTKLMAVLEKAFNFIAKVMTAILGLFGIKVNFAEGGGINSTLDDMSSGLGDVADSAGSAGDALGSAGDAAKGAGDSAKKAAKDTAKAAKDIKRSLAGFDQINTISVKDNGNDSGSGSGSGGSGSGSGGSGSGGSGSPSGSGSGSPDLNNAITKVELTPDEEFKMPNWLDKIIEKTKELASLFKKGFDLSFDYSKLEDIWESLKSIGESLKYIFFNEEVANSINNLLDKFAFASGQIIGAAANIGLSIIQALVGGIAKSLDENKDWIKNKIISIIDVKAETWEILGNFAQALSEIFGVVGEEEGKGIVANLISGMTYMYLTSYETLSKLGRDIADLVSGPIIANKDAIRDNFKSFLGTIESITGTVKDHIKSVCDTISKVYDEKIAPTFKRLKDMFSDSMGKFQEVYAKYVQPTLDRMAGKFNEVMDKYITPAINNLVDLFGSIIEILGAVYELALKPLIDFIIQVIVPTALPLLEAAFNKVITIIGIVIGVIGDLMGMISGLIEFIVGVFQGDWEKAWGGIHKIFDNFMKMIDDIWDGFVSMLTDNTIFNSVINFFKGMLDWISGRFEWFKEKAGPIFSDLWDKVVEIWNGAGDWFNLIVESIKKPFEPIINFITGIFGDAEKGAEDEWSGAPGAFGGFCTATVVPFGKLKEKIIGFFSNALNKSKDVWSKVKDWFNSKVINPIVHKFNYLKDKISDYLNKAWAIIKSVWNGGFTWFKTKVIDPIVTGFSTLKDKLIKFFSDSWSKIKSVWNAVKGYFKDIWNGITSIFNNVGTWFKDKFTYAWNNIKSAWSPVKNWFKDIWNSITNTFKNVGTWFKDKFTYAWNNIKSAWSSVKNWFKDIWNSITNTFNNVGTWFKDKFTHAWNNIKSAWSPVKNWFKDIWNSICNTFNNVGTWFKDKFSYAWNNIKSAWSPVKSWFKDIWNGITNVFNNVGTWFKDKFTYAWNNIKSAWSNVKSWFKDIWNGITSIFNNVGTWFKDKFSYAWNNIKNIWNSVKGYFKDIWNGIVSTFNSVNTWFKDKFQSAWNNIKNIWNYAKSYFSGIWSGITSIFSGVANWFRTQFNNAWNNIKNIWNTVKSYFNGVWNGIKSVFSGASGWFSSTFSSVKNAIANAFNSAKSTINGVWNGIKSIFSGASGWFSSTFNSVKNAILNPFNSVKSTISGVFNTVKNTVWNAVNSIKGAFNFRWSLPKITLPHFRVSGGKAPWGFGGKGSLPSISVQWYKNGKRDTAVLKSRKIGKNVFQFKNFINNILTKYKPKLELIYCAKRIL